MTRFSLFPGGLRGAALLLLRVSAASLLGIGFMRLPLSLWAGAGLIVIGLALLAGFGTRLAAGASALLAAMVFVRTGGILGWLVGLQALSSTALALLGAGVYSIDARLFGHRVIELRD